MILTSSPPRPLITRLIKGGLVSRLICCCFFFLDPRFRGGAFNTFSAFGGLRVCRAFLERLRAALVAFFVDRLARLASLVDCRALVRADLVARFASLICCFALASRFCDLASLRLSLKFSAEFLRCA